MKAELEYTGARCSVCEREEDIYDLRCADCNRIFGGVDHPIPDLTFHCYEESADEGVAIHLCNECNEKREDRTEPCNVSGCESLGYHRTAWNEVLCRECHNKKWKETIKKEEGVKK